MIDRRVVALGGGHGLAVSLRALRTLTTSLTAVVAVADDGGSSGRLRQAFGIPAPGDIRRCIIALGDPDSPWTQSFDTRFGVGELEGHAYGNLVIAGLTHATGDFIKSLDEVGKLVGAQGRVLPSTIEPVVLRAVANSDLGERQEVEGQVAVSKASRISVVSLSPPDPPAPKEVIAAIDDAEVIVLGPGSLFTSVLAACIVPDIQEAIARSSAKCVYVCNLWPQDSETLGFDVAAHIEALIAHGIDPDVVLYDPGSIEVGQLPIPGFAAAMANADGTSHDPARLSDLFAGVIG